MHVQGLRIRSQLANQERVILELQKMWEQHSNPLQETPYVQSHLEQRIHFKGTWLFQQDRAKLSMKTVRQLRRFVG